VRGEIIARVGEWNDVGDGATLVDGGDWLVMPGIVDTHVHVNQPGRTEWEGFETAALAAAVGGVTTLFDMPLNSIPATTTVAALDEKTKAAASHRRVNLGFLGGVVPDNVDQLRPLYEAGVRAFKCFLVPSGVDEFPAVAERDLRAALPVLAALGAPLMVHAELPERVIAATPATSNERRQYQRWLASRPDAAETEAVALMARLAAEYGARVHIVHLSSAQSLPLLREARARGVSVSAETCPHYLTFSAGEIPDGATHFKCAPPIRGAATREALWDALVQGDIDMVVSDHSPCPPDLKHLDSGDFFAAWGGISSLQLGLAAVWDGARRRGIAAERLAGWMSAAPAALVGLERSKGRIAPRFDADLVIWDPDATFVVGDHPIHHRHKLMPYLGRTLHGLVQATFVRGRPVYADGTFADCVAGALILPDPR
jgi:allantoinase